MPLKPLSLNQCRRSQTVIWIALALILGLTVPACSGRSAASNAPDEYEGTALDSPAADFRLVDQHGAAISLSEFRGQVVALTFMDSRCKETCPVTAVHLRKANQALGDEAASVVFLGINVNVTANAVTDVEAATQAWRLDEVPTWHFLTGSAAGLESVWKAYAIAVLPAPDGEEIGHTPGVYLIDRTRQVRWYISTPIDEAGSPQGFAPLSDLLVKHIRALLGEG